MHLFNTIVFIYKLFLSTFYYPIIYEIIFVLPTDEYPTTNILNKGKIYDYVCFEGLQPILSFIKKRLIFRYFDISSTNKLM